MWQRHDTQQCNDVVSFPIADMVVIVSSIVAVAMASNMSNSSVR